MATQFQPVASMKPAERKFFDELSEDAKGGYLQYRTEHRDKRAPAQRWRIGVAWNKLGPARQGEYIAAAQGAESDEGNGEGHMSVGGEGGAADPAPEDEVPDGGTNDPRASKGKGRAKEVGSVADKPRTRGKTPRGKSATKTPPASKPRTPAPEAPEHPGKRTGSRREGTKRKFSWEPPSSEDEAVRGGVGPSGEANLTWRWAKTLYDTRDKDKMWTVVLLYVQVDEGMNVQDRVVVKKIQCKTEDEKGILEQEFKITKKLDFCDHIMKIRSFVEQKGTLNVRMYSDYAPSGDLELIFDYYAPRDATDKTETSETPKQIPEPFIWLVFYALAEALFALNTGVCAKTGGADTGTSLDDIRKKKKGPWTSHQHADIKPKNIFLASPEDPYGAYPKPLLGDFDVAQPIRSQSASARRQERGTPGWKAPETENKDLHPVYDITSKTDIWAVGLVIWELMHASLGTERLELLRSTAATNFAFHANDTFPSERILGWNAMYTQTLHDLVTRCLKINPNQRPSFIELRKEVWEGMQRLKGVLGDFEGVDVVERLRLRFERGDEFAVGGVAELPERKKRKGGGGEELAPMPGDT